MNNKFAHFVIFIGLTFLGFLISCAWFIFATLIIVSAGIELFFRMIISLTVLWYNSVFKEHRKNS